MTVELAEDEARVLLALPGNALLVSMACAQAGVEVTQAEVEAIYSRADVTAQEPFVAMDRLGLMLVQPVEV